MDKDPDSRQRGPQPRKIVGFSLPPALAAEVKMEAAKRNLSLRKLFAEMWALYRTNNPT